jgi:hypothetical protein
MKFCLKHKGLKMAEKMQVKKIGIELLIERITVPELIR